MKLSELIAKEEEKVTFQVLNNCLAGVTVGKNDATVKFYTDKVKGQQLANAAVGMGQETDHVALIVWVPRSVLP